MLNSEINRKFLEAIGTSAATRILDTISKHYCVSSEQIREELTSEGAENILDYMTEPERSAAYALYLKNGFTLNPVRQK